MSALDFLVLVLAVWRLSRLLVVEAGPYDVLERLRTKAPYPIGGTPQREGLLECEYCTSLWAAPALLLAWQVGPGQVVVFLLALSGLAMLVKEWVDRGHDD